MSFHKVTILSASTSSDLKRLVIFIATTKGVSTNQAIDWVKHLPLTLFSSCSEEKAREVTATLKEMGVTTLCEPPLRAIKKKHSNNKHIYTTTKKDLKSTWTLSLSFIIVLFILSVAVLIPTVRWLWSTTRSNDQKSINTAQKAKQLIGQNKFAEASTILRSQIKANPYHSAPYIAEAINLISKARSEMDNKNWSDYGTPKKTQSSEPGGYENIPEQGSDRFPHPDMNRAIAILKKAIQINAENPEIYRWLGYSFQLKGLFNTAENHMNKAIELDTENILYRNLLGNLYIETEQYAKADYTFRQALELDPKNIHTLKNLGLLNQFYLKDTNMALHYYYKYMRENPSEQSDFDINIIKKELIEIVWNNYNTSPFPGIGKSTMTFTSYDSQRRILERKINSDNNADNLEEMATLFASNGKYAEAEDYFNKALIKDPKRISAYKSLAHLHASQNQLSVSAMMLNRALKHKAQDPFIYKNLALFEKYFNNNPEQALAYYKKYIQLGGDGFKMKMHREFNQ